jgi:hypothetical protein
MFTLKFNIDDAPKGIARRFDSRYDVVIRTLDDGTRTELHPMLQTPSGEYVRFEDYAKLVEKCERLKAEVVKHIEEASNARLKVAEVVKDAMQLKSEFDRLKGGQS